MLECWHRCSNVCGEICPSTAYCPKCCNSKLRSRIVDMIIILPYESLILNNDPILILPCGHFYTIHPLDGHLGLKNAYHWDENICKFIATKKIIAAANENIKKHCPDCRKVIHSIKWYGWIVHFFELKSSERKHMKSIDKSLSSWARKLEKPNCAKNIASIIQDIENGTMMRVYEACGGSRQV